MQNNSSSNIPLKKKIPIGIENYKEIIDEKFYYVDKTLLAKELLDSRSKAFLITRPRRFGKTLMMSMMENFFNIRKIPPRLQIIRNS